MHEVRDTFDIDFQHRTGFEIQPNVRLLWTPHTKHTLWAAVSRAVRTPARAEHDISMLNWVLPPFSSDNPEPFPIALTVVGDSDYESEKLLAYELGYRVVPVKFLSLDVTAFYNDYDNLRSNKLEEYSFQGTHVVMTNILNTCRRASLCPQRSNVVCTER